MRTTSLDYCHTAHFIDGTSYDAITSTREATNVMTMYLFLSILPSMQIAPIRYLDRQQRLLQLCLVSGFLCGVNEVFTPLGSVKFQKSEDLIAVTSQIANFEIFTAI